jgi:glycosyltransferase involved in cell wall biosynthesis/chemotaxis methyl-accepting protein methylase/tetratricopeptide (TPR) repeat protein
MKRTPTVHIFHSAQSFDEAERFAKVCVSVFHDNPVVLSFIDTASSAPVDSALLHHRSITDCDAIVLFDNIFFSKTPDLRALHTWYALVWLGLLTNTGVILAGQIGTEQVGRSRVGNLHRHLFSIATFKAAIIPEHLDLSHFETNIHTFNIAQYPNFAADIHTLASQHLDAAPSLKQQAPRVVRPIVHRVAETLIERFLTKGKPAAALELLDKLQATLDNDAFLWNGKGFIAHATGQTDQAIEHFMHALECDSANRDAIENLRQLGKSVQARMPGTSLRGRMEIPALGDNPLVTVYVPTYNVERWIETAIDSILGQTYQNLEVLIVDDGSSDRTVEIVRTYSDPRLRIEIIPHGGVAAARHYAMSLFKGDLIFNVDADDWIAPSLVDKLVSVMQQNPNVDVVYCNLQLVDENGMARDMVWEYSDYPDPDDLMRAMWRGGHSKVPGVLMERRVIARASGGFDTQLPSAPDFDHLVRVAAIARSFKCIPEPLYFYRQVSTALHTKTDKRNTTVNIVMRRMFERHGAEHLFGLPYKPDMSEQEALAEGLVMAGNHLFAMGVAYLHLGNTNHYFNNALSFYSEALEASPSHTQATAGLLKLKASAYCTETIDIGETTSQPVLIFPNAPLMDVVIEELLIERSSGDSAPVFVFLGPHASYEAMTVAIVLDKRGMIAQSLKLVAAHTDKKDLEEPFSRHFKHSDLLAGGYSALTEEDLLRCFDRQQDGTYTLVERLRECIDIALLESVTPDEGAPLPQAADFLFCESIWDAFTQEELIVLISAMLTRLAPGGFLLPGAFLPQRDEILRQRPQLRPDDRRHVVIHEGWRFRRATYGLESFGLEPIAANHPDRAWRYTSIFRNVPASAHSVETPDLKSYWQERGKIYKFQYPARPLGEQPVPHAIVSQLKRLAPESVLDWGAGFGKILKEVRTALPDARLYGLDISATVLLDGHRHLFGGSPVALVESDGVHIPLRDKSVAVSYTHVSLIHVPHENIRTVLSELVRVTRDCILIGETSETAHENFYYYAHDYPALFAELGLHAEPLPVPPSSADHQAKLLKVDLKSGAAARDPRSDTSSQSHTRKPLRLLVVSDRRSPHTRRYVSHFRNLGHEVHLFDASAEIDGMAGVFQHVPDSARYPEQDFPSKLFAKTTSLRDVIRRFEPDWVHSHFLVEWGWWAALASAGYRYASTAWGSDVFKLSTQPITSQTLTTWGIRQAQFVTGDSTDLVNGAQALIGDAPKAMLVPFGIDTDLFKPDIDASSLRRRLLIPEHASVVLSPRQFKPAANIETILHAFEQATKELPDSVLILKSYLTRSSSGLDDYERHIRQVITELDLWPRVRLVFDLPYQELPALYALSDVVLTHLDTDGTPCTLFEACATARPVIAANIPSLAEWIDDDITGSLTPLKDISVLADKLRRLLTDEDFRKKMGKAAREMAVREGDYRSAFGKIDEAYYTFSPPIPATSTRLEQITGHTLTVGQTMNVIRHELCTAIDDEKYGHARALLNLLLELSKQSDLNTPITLSGKQS